MKLNSILLGGFALTAFFGAEISASAAAKGTWVTHFMLRGPVVPGEFDPDASGSINLKHNKQGKADTQQLRLVFANLEPNTDYKLFVEQLGALEGVEAVTLTTDAEGRIRADFLTRGHGKGGGKKTGVPALLQPLNLTRFLVLTDQSLQTIATFDVVDAPVLKYQVKTSMTSTKADNDAAGTLRIHRTRTESQFRVMAAKLNPDTEYQLSLNDGVFTSPVTTDSRGTLRVTELPEEAPDLLDVMKVTLADPTGAVIFNTNLPE